MSDRAQQLLRLVDRVRRGTALPAELDQLADGITEQAARITTLEHVAAGNRKHAAAIVPELERAEAALDRVRVLATRWAVLRTHGGAAYELREALDEKPAETTPLVHQNTKPQDSHSAGADESALDEQQPTCCCGESTDPRVVHRVDGPCHMDEQHTT